MTGSKCPTASISIPSPSASAIFGASASIRAFMPSSIARSGERMSMVNTTRPGITLREFG